MNSQVVRRVQSKSGRIYEYANPISQGRKPTVHHPDFKYKPRLDSAHPRISIRKQCLERDNYTCQNCGAKGNLCVHHKDGCSYAKVGKKANNNLDNLITLCYKCHMLMHGRTKTERSRNLIEYHCAHPDMTYSALSRVFKLSRERIGQILGRKNKQKEKA